MGVQAELVLLLMFASSVKTQGVEFWRNSVILNCPRNGTWYDSEKEIHRGRTFEVQYKHALKYRCEYNEIINGDAFPKTYFFYVKGRACENCFELDANLFGLVIMVDVIGTAGLMMLIFRRTKKRSSDGPANLPKPPVPSRSRPETAQTVTYQELQIRTPASETYSTLNKTG